MKTKITRSAGSLTDSQLDDAERRLGRTIPTAYRNFLLQQNGGRPDPSDFRIARGAKGTPEDCAVKRFLGLDTPEETLNVDYVLETFRGRVPENLFPVARDPGGNLICIADQGVNAGKIYFWDHERESTEGEAPTEQNLYLIADSFEQFLNKLGEI